jgi:hypothetical protein
MKEIVIYNYVRNYLQHALYSSRLSYRLTCRHVCRVMLIPIWARVVVTDMLLNAYR